MARDWKAQLRRGRAELRSKARALERDSERLRAQAKEHIRAGRGENARMLAKNIAQLNAGVTRLAACEATLDGVVQQLEEQAALVKVSGVLQTSATMAADMRRLVNGAKFVSHVREVAAQMDAAGVFGEALGEQLDEAMAPTAAEVEVSDSVVDELLAEITAETAAKMALPAMRVTAPVAAGPATAAAAATVALQPQQLSDAEVEQALSRL
jgi:division protein CdvB (Snf7/Vps24/ESCRT-III family)